MSHWRLQPVLPGVILLLSVAARAGAAPTSHPLAYVGAADSSALLGIRQGLDEANVQGRFLGQTYTLQTWPAEVAALPKDTLAVYVSGTADTLYRLSKSYPKLPIFNLALDADDLRRACLPNVFHVLPSAQMKADALRQWRQLHPDTNAVALAWHSAFEKYSGLQLNSRFQKTQGRAMDELAWAGWAAVKMTADSSAHGAGQKQKRFLSYLRQDLSFDGQKGISLNFRRDGQLRQIVLLVENGRPVAEAPVRGVVDPQDLDSLGNTGNCGGTARKLR